MKLATGLIVVLGAIVLLSSVSLADDRMVLGEMFTNTSCGPCYQPELLLDQLAVNDVDYFALIRYHVWWPSSSDPYYQFNVSENTTRNNYYGNNYTPHLFIDGNIDGHETYGGWSALIENEAANLSALDMTLTGNYNPATDTGEITIYIIVEQAPSGNNLKLRFALTESGISWHAPNGISVHNQTFRDMFPSTGGQAVTLVQGDTLHYTFTFTTRNPINYENCQIIAFIQADQNRNVLQATKVDLPDLVQDGVDDNSTMPNAFSLAQNYPNPFNAQTKIDFSTAGGNTRLDVYDITGAKVATVLDASLAPGAYSIVWDGKNSNGQSVSSGTYLYRLTDSVNSQSKLMTLLK